MLERSQHNSPSPAPKNNQESKFPVGLRVLAVDDNIVCLKVLDTLLRKCNYEVTTTTKATEALEMLRTNKDDYDIVITDVNMLDMDGFELLEVIGLEMDIPVIMVSANDDINNVMMGVKHGARDYLVKPVRINELRNIWQHVIRKTVYDPSKTDTIISRKMENTLPLKKRKENIIENECETSAQSDGESNGNKKPRVSWTGVLHAKFVDAVQQLQVDNAVPKRILEIMNEPELTREHVASHLQKYRNFLKKQQEANTSHDSNMYADAQRLHGHSSLLNCNNSVNRQVIPPFIHTNSVDKHGFPQLIQKNSIEKQGLPPLIRSSSIGKQCLHPLIRTSSIEKQGFPPLIRTSSIEKQGFAPLIHTNSGEHGGLVNKQMMPFRDQILVNADTMINQRPILVPINQQDLIFQQNVMPDHHHHQDLPAMPIAMVGNIPQGAVWVQNTSLQTETNGMNFQTIHSRRKMVDEYNQIACQVPNVGPGQIAGPSGLPVYSIVPYSCSTSAFNLPANHQMLKDPISQANPATSSTSENKKVSETGQYDERNPMSGHGRGGSNTIGQTSSSSRINTTPKAEDSAIVKCLQIAKCDNPEPESNCSSPYDDLSVMVKEFSNNSAPKL